jgi:hypothetical protein
MAPVSVQTRQNNVYISAELSRLYLIGLITNISMVCFLRTGGLICPLRGLVTRRAEVFGIQSVYFRSSVKDVLTRFVQCTSCGGYFLETHGTIFHGKQVAVEVIVRVLACLAEVLGIRATARVFEVDPNTVLQWLVEAAEQLKAFSAYFLCDVHVNQLQFDELYAVLRDVQNGDLHEEEAIQCLERVPNWVWTAMDPKSKLLLVMDVGTRTLAMAQRMVHQVISVLAPGFVPLCVTDGLKDYGTTLLTHFGHWISARTTPRQRPQAQTALDAPVSVSLRPSREVVPTPAHCRGQASGDFRYA